MVKSSILGKAAIFCHFKNFWYPLDDTIFLSQHVISWIQCSLWVPNGIMANDTFAVGATEQQVIKLRDRIRVSDS